MNHTVTALACVALLSAACSTVTPPPPTMALAGASQAPTGSTALAGFAGTSGGTFIGQGLGGGARVEHRLSPAVALGATGVAGAVVDRNADDGPAIPSSLYAGRVHAQVNPGGAEGLALVLGVGGGATNNALSFVSVDAGARVGRRFLDGRLEPYAGLTVALSVPTQTPDGAVRAENDRRFLTTLWVGGEVGAVWHVDTRLDAGAGVQLLGAYSAAHDAALLIPTAHVRYAFGGR